jgi:hypothetical protein
MDLSTWKLALILGRANPQLAQADIRAEYFGDWLVVLRCEYGGFNSRFPVFRFMTNRKDFRRLLAFVRSGPGDNSG